MVIGGLAYFWQSGPLYEVDGVSLSNSIFIAVLFQSPKLVCICCIPGSVGGLAEDLVELLLNACVSIECSIGFSKEVGRVGKFSIG